MNIAPFSLPTQYYTGRVAPEHEQEVTNRVLQGTVPPLYWRSDARIMTFVPLDESNPLSQWLVDQAEARSVSRLQQERPTLAARLVHAHLVDIWKARGILNDDHTLYFPLPSIEQVNRSVRGPNGNLKQVCKAMFHTKDGIMAKAGDVNFVFHDAIEYGVTTYWGTTYLEITPKRYYTEDGKKGIKGEKAANIDRKFYHPTWDRGPERITKTRLWHHTVFDYPSFEAPIQPWFRMFQLGPLEEHKVPWSPSPTARQQSVLSEGA